MSDDDVEVQSAVAAGTDPLVFLRDDPRSYCQVHHRLLSYDESRAGGCFWCHPELIPPEPIAPVKKRRARK